jgi:hypothetical protein
MKRIFLIFFLLSGCTNNKTEKSNNLSNIIFSDNLSFEEFKIKLDEYAINNPYPNLDD